MTSKVPEKFADAEDAVHEAARAMAGFSDFGDSFYLTGFRVLLQALDEDPVLTQSGRDFVFRELVLTLVARLLTEEGWKQNPECFARPIRRPLIVTGLPRSATTTLHRLLAVDPQFQGLDSWLAHGPMVRPPREQWESLPAYQRASERIKAWFDVVPEFRTRHDMTVDDVEECIEVLRQDFVTNRFGCNFHVPSYDAWWLKQDESPAYRRYAKVLQLIGSGAPDKRWLLKNPGHIYQIDTLLEIFPDACIVYTHRDPLKAIPSVSSLIWVAHQLAEGPGARADVVGPRENLVWSRGTQPMLKARARSPKQFRDVQHGDFVADPLAVVHGIYEQFGLSLSPQVEAAMRDWVRANPLGKHGEHSYTLEQYGLTEGAIREKYQDYIDAYGPF